MTTLIAESTGVAKRARGSTRGGFSPSRALAALVAKQADRWILWLPPGMVAGAAFWMSAPVEPPAWLGCALLVAGTWLAFALRAWNASGVLTALKGALMGACALGACFGAGATASWLRGLQVAAPPLVASDEPVRLTGWVVANDASDTSPRLRILVRSMEGVERLPRYVRVSVREAGLLSAGRLASCRAVLGPPSGPMAPGAYDFARRAYFERLDATGFAFGRCRPEPYEAPPGWLDRQRLHLAALRADLAAAIVEAAPGRGGAIAAALVTGDRSSVDAETNAALRDSGLGHLLSVSGIHMGVVGGLVFAVVLWTLSLIAPIALRFPVKKIAAIAALLVLAVYLVVSGSSVPALRSFIMACVAFGAILLDRPAISMRGLALAAAVVTSIFPESVLEPGFQMSFAATMALVALFEMRKHTAPALPTPGPLIGALQATMRGIGGVLLISLIAGLATDPFAIYHFQRFSLYSLPANLIVAPIMSFLVAPAAAVAAVLAPFGYAEPALQVMASALDMVAAVGQTFGDRAEAVRALPRPPDSAFVLCVGALLWACLWRGVLRAGGLALFAGCLALYVTAPAPLIAFDGNVRAIYARVDEGSGARWALIAHQGRSTYARDRLGATLGLSPPVIERLAPPEHCGDASCSWRSAGRTFVFVRDEAGFAAACESNAVVITALPAPDAFLQRCAPATVLAADSLAEQGGAAIFETASGLRIERAIAPAFNRPWTRRGAVDQE